MIPLEGILAVGPQGEIGLQGKLPWHVPADLKLFKRLTLGHCLIMGRVTYEGIVRDFKRPLPQRHHLVLTRQLPVTPTSSEQTAGDWKTLYASSLDQLNELELKTRLGNHSEQLKFFLAGGALVYSEYLSKCSAIHLSLVDYQGPADTFIDRQQLIDPQIFEVVEDTKMDGFRYIRYSKRI